MGGITHGALVAGKEPDDMTLSAADPRPFDMLWNQ